MHKLKDESGAITVFVLVTMLFVISFLISTHILVSNRYKVQEERSKEIQQAYNNIDEGEKIYNSLFENNVIIIDNAERLLKIGTGDAEIIAGRRYVFDENAVYTITENIEFNAVDYYDILDGNDWTPIGDTSYKVETNSHIITVTKLNGVVKVYSNENQYKD